MKFLRYATVIGMAVGCAAYAQVNTINSVLMGPRTFNDVPGATISTVNAYPGLISFTETGVSAPSGFANMDMWRFSNDGGATAYAFNNNDFFQASMSLKLTADPLTPRKEAGFRLTTIGGDGLFIVNSDAHEVVAFGGPLPFYAFPATYNAGDTITLGMTYFMSGGLRYMMYTANGVNSPPLPFTNLEQGIIDGSTFGGYFQIVNAPNTPSNMGSATFMNISIVPEPATFALLGLGTLALLFRRRS